MSQTINTLKFIKAMTEYVDCTFDEEKSPNTQQQIEAEALDKAIKGMEMLPQLIEALEEIIEYMIEDDFVKTKYRELLKKAKEIL
jgi:hypothetical protein